VGSCIAYRVYEKWDHVLLTGCMGSGIMYCLQGVWEVGSCIAYRVYEKWDHVLLTGCMGSGIMYCLQGVWESN
jgi:hypothetical protein